MKKFLKLLFVFTMMLMITGCVKMEISMGIHKDKSMDMEIIQAFDESLMADGESLFDDDVISDAEDQGFLVREYNENSFKGYVFTKTFDNIDDLSTEERDITSDLSLVFDTSDVTLFSIKEGFFKNTYKAKFDFSSDDMDFDDSLGGQGSTSDSDLTDDLDYSQLMNGMEMNFVVSLPYKVVESNATLVQDSGKTLSWDLLTLEDETADFEFELYNMTNIYLVVGGALIVMVWLILTISKKIAKNSSNGKKNYNNVMGQDYYSNMNNGYNEQEPAFDGFQSNNTIPSQSNTVNIMGTNSIVSDANDDMNGFQNFDILQQSEVVENVEPIPNQDMSTVTNEVNDLQNFDMPQQSQVVESVEPIPSQGISNVPEQPSVTEKVEAVSSQGLSFGSFDHIRRDDSSDFIDE